MAQDWQDTSGETKVYTATLHTKPNGTFKIAQLGDLMHDPTPSNSVRTQEVIENIIANVQPDLFVITGDTVNPAFAY